MSTDYIHNYNYNFVHLVYTYACFSLWFFSNVAEKHNAHCHINIDTHISILTHLNNNNSSNNNNNNVNINNHNIIRAEKVN